MTKTLPRWAFGVLSVVGAVLVGSMLLTWIDLGGEFRVSGLGLAWEANHWLFLVPVAGALLLATAVSKSEHTRLAAIFAGIAITGYVLFGLSRGILKAGVDTWLMLGGAGALLAGVSKERAALRAIGGIAILTGFVAPWADYSLFAVLRSGFADDWTFRVLWLVPLAGLTGLASAVAGNLGPKLAASSGIAVYGAFLYVIGSVAWAVFGIGAWLALGASTVALVIGVLARGHAELAAVTPAKSKPAA